MVITRVFPFPAPASIKSAGCFRNRLPLGFVQLLQEVLFQWEPSYPHGGTASKSMPFTRVIPQRTTVPRPNSGQHDGQAVHLGAWA